MGGFGGTGAGLTAALESGGMEGLAATAGGGEACQFFSAALKKTAQEDVGHSTFHFQLRIAIP